MLASAAPAGAHDGVKVTVTPATLTAGADVDVYVQGCTGTTGAVKSPAFVADVELSGRDGKGRPLFGDTSIRSTVRAGTYPVTVTCDGHDHADAGSLRIGDAHKGPQPDQDHHRQGSERRDHQQSPEQSPEQSPDLGPEPDADLHTDLGPEADADLHTDLGPAQDREQAGRPQALHTPVAPVRAGGGGTAALAADAPAPMPPHGEGQGPGTPHTVIGLILAAVTAVLVAVRGVRRRRNGTD